MRINFATLLDAYESANFGEPGSASAFVSTKTGETYLYFEDGDNEGLPEDLDESPEYILLPDKTDLDLGQRLVWEFVCDRLPDQEGRVRDMFRGRGAYRRFKDFLASCDLLEAWYAHQSARTREELIAWCQRKGLEIHHADDPGG